MRCAMREGVVALRGFYLYVQLSVVPLHLLDDVQRAVQDELVQVAGLVREARLPIAALLRGAELVLEEGVVLGADNGKVVGHVSVIDRSSGGFLGLLFYGRASP